MEELSVASGPQLQVEGVSGLAIIGRGVNAPRAFTVDVTRRSALVSSSESDAAGSFAVAAPEDLADGQLHQLALRSSFGDLVEILVVFDPILVGKERPELQPRTAEGRLLERGDRIYPGGVEGTPAGETPAFSGDHTRDETSYLAQMVDALRVQTDTLRFLLNRAVETGTHNSGPLARDGEPSLTDRYGGLVCEAASRPKSVRDVIWLGVIDWDFRIQRPQHLAAGLAELGCRVFYVSIQFEVADERGRFSIISTPRRGVFEVRLRLTGPVPQSIYAGFTEAQVEALQEALDEMMTVLTIEEPAVVVQYPSWYPVACGIGGATVVHDCLDLIGGFENVPESMVELESKLVETADVVIASSAPLREHLLPGRRSVALVRNAAEVDFFGRAATTSTESRKHRPRVGYFGAIAHWFELDWVKRAASNRPDWEFILIGSTEGATIASLRSLKNVHFLGERPYDELPDHLALFDVAIIPFKLIDLILCTNPVKLYEYSAAGKPVVASAMPEVVAATDLVYIASDAEDFERQIEKALDEDSPELRRRRLEWASQHSWDLRAQQFLDAIDGDTPKVSVVVLSFNQWHHTEATLWSLISFSDYSNLEIIVVDNGSTDGSAEKLRRFARRDPRLNIILKETNLGYAAGNNVGLCAATGEILVLLNNDTYVTRGWLRDLIRPLRLDLQVGLVSPLTNNIGNEQKIAISYADMQEMARDARKVTRRYPRQRLETGSVAFFCVAMRRDVLDKVGLLDEAYGIGFFEDDDYCRRVVEAGYRVQIVDDVFVHHHLSASFDAIGFEEKSKLLARNRAIFESRWGEWKPHSYRAAPGFG